MCWLARAYHLASLSRTHAVESAMLKKTLSLLLSCLFLLPIFGASAYGQDSTAFNPTTVVVEAKGSGGVPVGTIVAWPVATNPADWDNWLECNGQAVDASVYPELRSLVGANVPDLRGLFLRGHGGNSAPLGVYQASQNLRHTHSTKNGAQIWTGGTSVGLALTSGGHRHSNSDGLTEEGGDEARPVNMAVRYIIRARP